MKDPIDVPAAGFGAKRIQVCGRRLFAVSMQQDWPVAAHRSMLCFAPKRGSHRATCKVEGCENMMSPSPGQM